MDELKKELLEKLNDLLDKGIEGGEFLAGKIPMVAEQFLNYKAVVAWTSLGTCLFFILTGVGFWVIASLVKKERKADDLVFAFALIAVCIWAVCGICAYNLAETLLHIYYSPTTYLIQEIRSF